MKKFLAVVAVSILVNGNYLKAEDKNSKIETQTKVVSASDNSKNTTYPKLVSMDGMSLMERSKEGKLLAQKIQKDVEKFQEHVKNAQQELVNFQETVTKQAKVLSQDAMMEKGEKLAQMKKGAERELSDREEELKKNIRKEQIVLRDRQFAIANKVFDDKEWGMMIDKNTPGVLFVSKAIDKTDDILKVVDEEYDKEIAKKVVAKENSKQPLGLNSTKKA